MFELNEKKDVDRDNLLNLLDQTTNHYSKIVQKILDIDSKDIDKRELKDFAYFQYKISNALCGEGYSTVYLGLSLELIEKLSPRTRSYQFTQKQFVEENGEFFDYFSDLDKKLSQFRNLVDPKSFSDYFSDINKLLDESPPQSVQKGTTYESTKQYLTKGYIANYLDIIADTYESFLLICLYWLILFKILEKEDIKKNLRDLCNSKKLPIAQLYYDDSSELLKLQDYLKNYSMDEEVKKRLLQSFENILGADSIRQLRNLKVHHFGEESMKGDGEVLKVIYPTGKQESYSVDDLNRLKNNFKLNI